METVILFYLFLILHAGGTTFLHFMWLLAVGLILLLATVVSGLAAIWSRGERVRQSRASQ